MPLVFAAASVILTGAVAIVAMLVAEDAATASPAAIAAVLKSSTVI